MKPEYLQRPQDFTRQILAEGTYLDMVKFESTILKSANSARDPHFYNLNNGDGKFHHSVKGRIKSPEEREKIRRSSIGRKASPETRAKMSRAQKGRKAWNLGMKGIVRKSPKVPPWNKGKKHSPETREKLSMMATRREERKRQKLPQS